MTSTEARQEGGSAQDPFMKSMTPWTFDMKFPLGTQFTFGSLTFDVGEDGDLKMLPLGPATEHPTPAPSSTSGSSYSDLDPFAGLYIRTANLIRGFLIVATTLRPFTGAPSSSSLASSPAEIHLMITLRSGLVPVGTPPRTAASSLWWSQEGIGPATAPVGIPLLEDQRHLMPKPLALGWFRI
jgi:hypothetical protein